MLPQVESLIENFAPSGNPFPGVWGAQNLITSK